MWNLTGTTMQNALVQQALDRCDFPWDDMLPSLTREGKTQITVSWADLSRYSNDPAAAHEHGAHLIIREVDGRARVLGLFYLPPYTKVVLDLSLASNPPLAHEVFLAEAWHAADYHSLVPRGLRPAVWNALHADQYDVVAVPESGDINHGHSWFDGPAGYATWVGETLMALGSAAFASTVPVTIDLRHSITDEAVRVLREAYFPPEPAVGRVYQGKPTSKVVHDSHDRIEPQRWFDSLAEAQAAGLRACRVCRP